VSLCFAILTITEKSVIPSRSSQRHQGFSSRTLSIASNLFATLNSHIGPIVELIHNKSHAGTRRVRNIARKQLACTGDFVANGPIASFPFCRHLRQHGFVLVDIAMIDLTLGRYNRFTICVGPFVFKSECTRSNSVARTLKVFDLDQALAVMQPINLGSGEDPILDLDRCDALSHLGQMVRASCWQRRSLCAQTVTSGPIWCFAPSPLVCSGGWR
jgi:hypothetical protein